MKKLFAVAFGMTFLPMLGLFLLSKLADLVDDIEMNDEDWTPEYWKWWYGDEE